MTTTKIRGLFLAIALLTSQSHEGLAAQWITVSPGLPEQLRAVAFGNNLFVAGGQNGKYLFSTDGQNWSDGTSPTNLTVNGMAFGLNQFVAVGTNGLIANSEDGEIWKVVSGPVITNLNSVLFDGTQFVAAGDGGILLGSVDGQIWQSNGISGANGFSAITIGVLEAVPKYVTVGRDGSIYSAEDFKNLLLGTTLAAALNGVTIGAAKSVAVGDSGKTAFSSNGKDWQTVDVAPAVNFNGAFFDGAQFYALGGNGTIITSTDGQSWQPEVSNTAAELRAGVQGAGKLVAVGNAGTILLKYLDTDPPTLAVTNFTDLQTISNSPVTIRGTATDVGHGGNGVTVLLTGAFGVLGGADGNGVAAWRITAPLANGTNKFEFVAQDNAGNSRTNLLRLILVSVPSITWATPADIVYGRSLAAAQLNATATVSGANVAGTFVYSPALGTVLAAGNAQTLSVTFTPMDTTRYLPAAAAVSINVLKAPLAVTANDANRSYGSANPDFNATSSGFVNGDTVAVVSGTPNFSTTATASSPVGNYDIVPALGTLSAANYQFTSFINGTLAVTPAALMITANNRSKIYGQAVAFAGTEFTTTVLPNSETVGAVTLVSSGAAAGAAVGGYNITPSAASGGTFNSANYTITYQDGTLAVSPAALTITANNRSKAYGEAVAFAGTEFATSLLQNSETVGSVVLSSSGAAAGAGVGSYSIAPSGASGGTFNAANYTITYQDGTLTVSPATLAITANNRSKAYGEAVVFAGAEFTTSLLPNSETVGSVALSSIGAAAGAGVGSYNILPSAATGGTFNAANYTITYQDGTLAVSPAAITVTANNRSKAYGEAVAFAGTEFTASALPNSETVGSVTLTSSGAAATAGVGSYNILVSAVTGGTFNVANYTITYQDGTLAVSPAALTITANNRSKAYGEAVAFAGTEFTTSALPNAETVGSVTLTSSGATATAGLSGSPFTIVPSAVTGGTFNSANYTITYQNGALRVSPAALTVTANDTNRVYGATNPAFTGTMIGLENNDDIIANYSCSAASDSPVGMYDIVPSLLDPSGKLGNYTVTTNNGLLSITTPQPSISNPSLVGQNFSLSVSTALGPNYILEYKNSLADPGWTATQTLPGTGGTITLTDNTATNPARFYRVHVQ